MLVAFSGLDASSGLAGQVAIGRSGLRRLIAVRLLAAIVPYVGIAIVASIALPNDPDRTWIEAPMLGVVDEFSQEWLREPLRYLVAVVGGRDPRRGVQRARCSACRGSATRSRSTARSRRGSATCTRGRRRRS